MPNLNDTRAALAQLFVAGWTSRTPIAYDNVDFSETAGQAYVSLIFVPHGSKNVTLGSQLAGCKRVRYEGVMSVIIRVPLAVGSGLAWDYADTIQGFMDNKSVVSNLFTYSSKARRSGENKDGWYSLILDIPYTSDLQ